MKPFLPSILALACAGSAVSAQADTTESNLSFSGFATVGAVRTNTEQAEFAVPGQPSGTSTAWSLKPDSKIGGQLAGKFNSIFSATLQAVAKDDGNGKEKAGVEWLFGKTQISPSLAFRVGRMGLPAFAVSDFRDVDYANLWVRPPLDVYGQVPVSHFDGADAVYQTNLENTTLTGQVFGGRAKAVYQSTQIKLDALMGFNLTAEFDGGVTLRVGHLKTDLTVESQSLMDLVAAIRSTPFAAVGDQLDPVKKQATFSGIGLIVDRDAWLVNAEYTKRTTKTYAPSTTGWSATAGVHLGKFTPYLVASKLQTDSTNVDNTIPVGVDPGLDYLSAAVDGVVGGQYLGQKTQSVGLRWDAYRNLAVKAQLDHVQPDTGPVGLGKGLFTKLGTTSAVNVLSVAVNLVF